MNPFEEQARQERRRQQSRLCITADVAWIISQRPGTVCWHATLRDLAEMVDVAWQSGQLCDDRALPLPRAEIARRAYAAIGQPVPANLSAVLTGIRCRHDLRRSVVERYKLLASGPLSSQPQQSNPFYTSAS